MKKIRLTRHCERSEAISSHGVRGFFSSDAGNKNLSVMFPVNFPYALLVLFYRVAHECPLEYLHDI